MWIIWSEINGALKRLSAMRVLGKNVCVYGINRWDGKEERTKEMKMKTRECFSVIMCGTCVRRHFSLIITLRSSHQEKNPFYLEPLKTSSSWRRWSFYVSASQNCSPEKKPNHTLWFYRVRCAVYVAFNQPRPSDILTYNIVRHNIP